MPRALWICVESPNRSGGGGDIRQSHLLEALARHMPTDLWTVGGTPDDVVASAVTNVTVLPDVAAPSRGRVNQRLRRWHRLAIAQEALEVPYAASAARSFGVELAQLVDPASQYDLVYVAHPGLAPLISRRAAGRHWVLDLAYLPSLAAEQHAIVAGRARGATLRLEARAARRLEASAAQRYDAVVAVSDADAAALPGDTLVVPNGVDTARFHPTSVPSNPHLVFTGTLGFGPNADGLTWFAREVLPLIHAERSDVTTAVVGRSPVPEVVALDGQHGITVHLDVPDVAPYLDAARIAIVPLRFGSGTRLKALEAMAAGRPVIGTSIGLAGLGLVDGRHALIRDTASDTAAAIISLIDDTATAQRLGDAGRAYVEQHYSWSTITRQWLSALDRIVDV